MTVNISGDTGVSAVQSGATIPELNVDSGTFYVDAANNRVGIGTSSPTAKLDLLTSGTANVALFRAGAGHNSFLSVIGNGNSFLSTSFDIVQNSNNQAELAQRANAPMVFYTNNTERMRIDSSGHVTMPYQPVFLVGYNTSTNLSVSTGNKVTFNQKNFDNNNDFDTTNSRFTAPVTGKYRLAASFQSDTSQNGRPVYRKNGSDFFITTDVVQSTSYITSAANYQMTLILDIIMPLNAGDYVEIWQRGGGGTLAYYAGHSYWNGYLIG